jgi:H+-transporting ATPase
MPMKELQAKLESSPEGLTQAEAAKRRIKDPFLKFLTYLWGPIP